MADIIQKNTGDDSVINIVEALAEYFQSIDCNFDKKKFTNDCGFRFRKDQER